MTTRKFRRCFFAVRPRATAALVAAGFGLVSVLSASAQVGPKLPRKQDEKVQKGPTGPAEQQFPFGGTWVLTSFEGKPIGSDAPSFSLDDKLRAVGFGGCNTFSMALYPIREQKLAAGAIALTRKSCGKPLDDVEHDFLIGLHSLPKWHLEANGDLSVKGQTGTMMFRRGL